MRPELVLAVVAPEKVRCSPADARTSPTALFWSRAVTRPVPLTSPELARALPNSRDAMPWGMDQKMRAPAAVLSKRRRPRRERWVGL